MGRQYDAHVRARKRLLRKVVDRQRDWGLPFHLRGLSYEEAEAALFASAKRRLARFEWPEGWSVKLGPYHPYARREVLGIYKTIPASIIHGIMCTPEIREDT